MVSHVATAGTIRRRLSKLIPSSTGAMRRRFGRRYNTLRSKWQPTIGPVHYYFFIAAYTTLVAASQPPPHGTTSDGTYLALGITLTVIAALATAATWLRLPKFGQKATYKQLSDIIYISGTHYFVAGFVAPIIVLAKGWVGLGVALVMLLNTIFTNYCSLRWNRALSAQRDIGKLMFRIPVLYTLLFLSAAVNITPTITSLALGISLLLLPFTLETVMVVRKSL